MRTTSAKKSIIMTLVSNFLRERPRLVSKKIATRIETEKRLEK